MNFVEKVGFPAAVLLLAATYAYKLEKPVVTQLVENMKSQAKANVINAEANILHARANEHHAMANEQHATTIAKLTTERVNRNRD